jgi:hypothetical protein
LSRYDIVSLRRSKNSRLLWFSKASQYYHGTPYQTLKQRTACTRLAFLYFQESPDDHNKALSIESQELSGLQAGRLEELTETINRFLAQC